MQRPNFISNKDIARWNIELINDPIIPQDLIKSPLIKEVCYAGMWLVEELTKLKCPVETITDLQYSAGKASFGKDVWEIHQKFLAEYNDNKIKFIVDPKTLN